MDWPDWSGETAVIVGTGPSVQQVDLSPARGAAKVIVIKGEYRHCRWADALYGIDTGWWIASRGARDFEGLKFSPAPTVCRLFPEVRQIRLRPVAQMLVAEKGLLGCGLRTGGGHSGFQAMNLAVQFGATRILLVGFDMWGGRRQANEAGVAKLDPRRVEEWRLALEGAAAQIASLGVEVINCSPGSALKAFPASTLAAALRDTNLAGLFNGRQDDSRSTGSGLLGHPV